MRWQLTQRATALVDSMGNPVWQQFIAERLCGSANWRGTCQTNPGAAEIADATGWGVHALSLDETNRAGEDPTE